jgi:hypothetical protein
MAYELLNEIFGITDDKPKTPSLLSHFERIVQHTKTEGFTHEFWQEAKDSINVVSEKLGIMPLQAALFAHFLNRSDDQPISRDEIAKSIKCTPIQMLELLDDIDVLVEKGFLRSCGKSHNYSTDRTTDRYVIPADLITAIRKGKKITNLNYAHLTLPDFIDKIESIFEQFDNNDFTYSEVYAEIIALFRGNLKLDFVRRIRNYKLSAASLILLSHFCISLINDNEHLTAGVIQNHCANRFQGRHVVQQFISGEHELVKAGLVEHAGKEDFQDTEIFSLSAANTSLSKRD